LAENGVLEDEKERTPMPTLLTLFVEFAVAVFVRRFDEEEDVLIVALCVYI
jgi:hypothetical protein